jgi:predicted DNA-binding transcriptional regulator YafY
MVKFKPQYRRLLFIDGKLREKAYPNCTTLAADWEVSVKTIQRDLDYLRDELEAPIAYDDVRHGYHYTEPSYSLPAIRLAESDLFAVLIAEQCLGKFRQTPLHGKLASVFSKIRESLPDATSASPAWLSDRILLFPEPSTRIAPRTWDTVARAIRENRRLIITHRAPSRKAIPETERKVDPYYLVNHRGEWYLSSYCHLRRSIRTFGVSRISKARLLDETFVMPKGMTKEKMFGDLFGIIWNDQFHKVRIRFSPEVAPYVRERQWHPAQRITDRRDGSLILEFTTNHLNEVKDWVLSWGNGAQVLSPMMLRDKTVRALRQALQRYG